MTDNIGRVRILRCWKLARGRGQNKQSNKPAGKQKGEYHPCLTYILLDPNVQVSCTERVSGGTSGMGGGGEDVASKPKGKYIRSTQC